MSLNAIALEVTDQEGDIAITPIIDSIIDGDFATLIGLSNWNLSYNSAWELGYSTPEELVTYTDWHLPTVDALVEIRSLQDSGDITPSNGYNLLHAFNSNGGTKYWSSTEVTQTTNELSVPEIPSIGDTLGGGKVYWVWTYSHKVYVVADGGSSNLYANTWGCSGTPINQDSNNDYISSGSGNSWNMMNQCSDTNTPAWACENFDNGYLGSWYLPSINALQQIRSSNVYSGISLDTNRLYWSSTQEDADEAWVYAFDDVSLPTSSTSYSDWYLPSKDELEEMYRQRWLIGGFWVVPYWSSSESLDGGAWYVFFGSGVASYSDKTVTLKVRVIRTANTFPSSKPIGDTHEGGIIFYKSGSTCLIAAKEDLPGAIQWGCNKVVTGATSVSIGTGQQNTTDILNSCSDTDSAAHLANTYTTTDTIYTEYSAGKHSVSKNGIMWNGGTEIFTRPVRDFEYNVVTPKAYAVNTYKYAGGFKDPEQKDKYNTYHIRPVKNVSILESEGIYNVGDSLHGGKVFHKSTTQEVEGTLQVLQVVANSDADSSKWNCYNEWNTTGMSVSGVADSAFATNQMRGSSCTGSTGATQSCDQHSEEGMESTGSTWGLITNSASWQPIYIRQLCTHIGQDYILSITVENLTSGEGVLSVSGGVDSSFNETITTSNTHTFSFTSDSEYIYINSLQGNSGNFTGVITSISLVHDNIIHNYEDPIGIVFPLIHHESDSVDLGSDNHSETQTITFEPGWNLFSLWIDVDGDYDGDHSTFNPGGVRDKDIMNVFKDQSPAWDEIIIVKDNDGNAWLPEWDFNGIGDFVNGQGYQIKVENTCTFEFTGNPINTETANGNHMYGMTLELSGGWNLMAAPWKPGLVVNNENYQGYDAEIFFEDELENTIIVKNNGGDAYLTAWNFNGIGELLSGQAYQVKMEGDSSDTYYIDATYTPQE